MCGPELECSFKKEPRTGPQGVGVFGSLEGLMLHQEFAEGGIEFFPQEKILREVQEPEPPVSHPFWRVVATFPPQETD